MKRRENIGIKVLSDISKINSAPNTQSLGFSLGPRINAGGRIGNSELGVNLLKENDESKAFEKAGLINAVDVKVQPDDAIWDAGDIRYNVLRWTSSPRPPFGGYGPSFVNPRTGQILGADIMLEYVYFTNRVKYEKFMIPLHRVIHNKMN